MEASSSQGKSMSSSMNDLDKQQYQAHNMAGQRQHEALASLFRSLSSLASGSNSQQFHRNSPPQLPEHNPQDFTPSKMPIKRNFSNPPNPTDTIADSIQSVVAAAVMQQQQLVVEAMNLQQQQRHQLAPQPPTATQRAPPSASHQPVSLQGFLRDQMNTTPNYQLAEQQRAHVDVAPSRGLEREVQLITTATARPTNLSTNTQPSQRINYCTICNKELCNKYFMKTHMLKMHGINLEMEQQQQQAAASSERANSEKEDGKAAARPNDDQERVRTCDQNESSSEGSTSNSECNQTGVQLSGSQQKSKSANELASNEGTNSAAARNRPAPTGAAKQATSVLNGFAGNSMGGVVCDICNKELCSKYFLKVHKQNTHGIVTDYQDASQFVYPFVNPLAAANPFLQSTIPLSAPNVMSYAAMCFNGGGHQSGAGPSASKRPRSDKARPDVNSPKQVANPVNEVANDGALDPLYELMLAQQKQQQPAQQQQGFDQMNRVNAMMCYGAMSPFGPSAGISPTMIVEMILRNQHLFNRDNLQQGQPNPNQTGRSARRDRSSKTSESKSKSRAASSKEANNSRYFIHYTEACPMCDRRFKSIKWLKTHMMNDHKQEIAAYMQMMVQSVYTARNQPQQQEQHNSLTSASFPLGLPKVNATGRDDLEPCSILVQQLEQRPLRSPLLQTPGLSNPINVEPSLTEPAAIQTGLPQTIHNGQFSLIQNYLDQQRRMLQESMQTHQMAINLSSAESSQQFKVADQNQLGNLDVMNHISLPVAPSSSSSSSRSSSAKQTSPHSMGSLLDVDQPQSDQLDLSIKYNSDSQSFFLNAGAEFSRAQRQDGTKLDERDYFERDDDDEDDDDCSRQSSPRHDAPLNPDTQLGAAGSHGG